MDRSALLNEFKGKVDEFEKYQGYIDKTKSQSAKFAATVVEKVIKDNTEKCNKLAEIIIPLMTDVESVIEEMSAERLAALGGRETTEFDLQVLELRQVIGDLTDDAYLADATSLTEAIAAIDTNVAAIDVVFNQYKDVLGRWQAVGERSGILAAPKPVKASKKGKSMQGLA